LSVKEDYGLILVQDKT